MNNLSLKSIYAVRKIPVRYLKETYEEVNISEPRRKILVGKIFNAPQEGVMLVNGTAGPIINQLYEMGRKVIGLSFVEFYTSKMSDEKDYIPKNVEVCVLYGIGNEPSTNTNFSSKVLSEILDFYKNRETLVILETSLSSTDFSVKYGQDIKNKVNLQLKEVESWL